MAHLLPGVLLDRRGARSGVVRLVDARRTALARVARADDGRNGNAGSGGDRYLLARQ